MMKIRHLLSLIVLAALPPLVAAQESQTGYILSDGTLTHTLNPAFQPERGYISLPLLGGTSLDWQSSMHMKDLLFDQSDRRLTTFMSPGTISKSDLLHRVGSGLRTTLSMRFTLISLGRRRDADRYQTLSLTWRNQVDARLSRDLFSCLKEVENGTYDLSSTSLRATSYLEASAGESRRLNDHWTVGLKAKLLAGLAQAEVEADGLKVNLQDETWTAQGRVTANASGLKYLSRTKQYKSHTGTYQYVNDVEVGGIGLNGIGLALDAGATYRPTEHWQLSASLLDLGFITWFKSNQAANSGDTFQFDGFQDVCLKKSESNSFKQQGDRLTDDLLDMARLQDQGRHTHTRMLSATLNLGASYRYNWLTCGALLTGRVGGPCSWVEGRLQAAVHPLRWMDVVLSPAYSRFGGSFGGMLRFTARRGTQVWLSSDRMFQWQVNKQFVPTALSASLQFGATFPLGTHPQSSLKGGR